MTKKRRLIFVLFACALVYGYGAASVHAQGVTDLQLEEVIVTQAVNNEPLILNKNTVVRATVRVPAPMDVRVTVTFDGQAFTETKSISGNQETIDVFVGAPKNLQTQTVNVHVETVGEETDPDLSNNERSVTLPIVKPVEQVRAFFLPVDWTEDQRRRYNFDVEFPKFVQENGVYLRGAFPLGEDQILADYTLVPHMLAANEKRLSNNQGDFDAISSHLLYATISLAARRLKPDATLVVGVFPPGWFAAHGNKNALGLALADVDGTVTAQYVLTDATTSAHELAHLFWLYEDYDFSIKPGRPFTFVDRSGYFVQKQEPKQVSDTNKIPTFLSAYSPDRPSWVDTRIYEYLTAKFTIEGGGEVSEPTVLAATISKQVEPDGKNFPSDYAAGYQRFEPKQTVYIAVGAAGMRGGETLEARWFQGDSQVFTSAETVTPGNAWYSFAIRNRNGMPQGFYRVEIYLDGALAKTSHFQVMSSQ